MDPNVYSPETLGERYFESLNTSGELHIVKQANLGQQDIKADVTAWFAGFRSCLQMLPQIVPAPTNANLGNLSGRLPPVEGVIGYVTKHFDQKAKIAA
jgi:hypothetical protein